MSKRKPKPDYNKDITYYLQVVNTNKKGEPLRTPKPLIKLTDCNGNWIQWVNDAQAALLEQELPGQIQWR
jgi:hypothetical protein